jgi:hypothetical protein
MARRLRISDDNDAITTRATTQSRRRQRRQRINGDDSFARSPSSSTSSPVVPSQSSSILSPSSSRSLPVVPSPSLPTLSSVASSSSSSALYPRDAAKVLPLPPIAQKSPYAYFFVGNDYYLKLLVMHFLFFTAWTANKKAIFCSEISKKKYSGPRKDSLLIT